MLNLLKSDFYKLKKSKAFWICTALCIVFGIIMVIAIQMDLIKETAIPNVNNPEYVQALEMLSNASGVWALSYFLPLGLNVLFVGVFIAIFVSSEFGYGTMKNTLSRGADRTKVFLSKIIVCSCASIVMLLLFMLAVLTTGSVVWGYDPQGIASSSNMLAMVVLQMLLMLSYTALFTFISVTIRSNGGAIAANIMCSTVATYLFTALSMLFGGNLDLNNYWIGGAVSKLATVTATSSDVVQGIFVAIIWIMASILVGTALFRKQDVK